MEQKSDKSEQIAMSHQSMLLPMADKSCSETSTPVKKLHNQATKHLDANIMFPTPEKINETLNISSKEEPAKLPEKYRILSDLFNRMTTSLRLLNLRKQLPTFRNICHQVEKLTGRKFSYRHLAQMKFVLPEAIQTDKILLHNNKTLTMESDIKVTLLFDVVEGHVEHSNYIALCHTFSSRLLKFVNTHSEGCDVPEADLPESFNQKEITTNSLYVDSSREEIPNVEESELLNPSHLEPSFCRHFTKKDNEDTTSEKETGFSSCLDPVKQEKTLEAVNLGTPMKPLLLRDGVSVVTPDLSTPKRSFSTEDNKLKSMVCQKVMASSLSTKRSLFSNADNEGVVLEEETISASVPSGKADEKSCLSDLVETIYNIFLSANCSSITKSELVHKVLVNDFDIIENGEIEDQIDVLVKKVPDWISKKVAPSGDILYNINKGLDLKSVTGKLM